MIKLSIVIPVFNMEKYLEQCLDSVVAQTITNKEIICINDGSTDKSLNILKKYADKFKYIKIIDQKNSGVSKSRNLGIDLSKGEYVSFIDPDDWYPTSDILDYLYQKAKLEEVSICGGSFSSFYFGNVKDMYEGVSGGYTFCHDGRIKFKDYQWDYGYHRFIYKLEMLRKNKVYFPEYERYQDPPFLVNAMLIAKEFYGVKKIAYRYRIGHKEIKWTTSKTRDLLMGLIDNLIISKEYGLSKLHFNTVMRINNEFLEPIVNQLICNEIEILELVLKVSDIVDLGLLKKESLLIDNDYKILPIEILEKYDLKRIKDFLEIDLR